MNNQNSKPKIYLDTSVPSHLYATEAPRQMADTWRLWAAIRAGEYDTFISTTVTDELEAAPKLKQDLIFNEINIAKIKILMPSNKVKQLAAEYIKAGILSDKHYDDCMHIAFASIHGCEVLVSWNFRHLVKTKTMDGTKVVNKNNQCEEIVIVSPAILLEMRRTI
jgi:predicted nucleic acid-binding protein